ncbi:MAG: YceI family protein [Armatimonadota bacterium]|nr:YceI family protein [Armatimonadota bacterium]MDR7450331.1 YceI family protein [Armatimonadota bacterium]MDR7467086.1 YceI family protein [Armatimonadota bacterium]MDR7493372.1 YceI family protein [Armatimonadota bacterium]MDR7499380.1 YceI family protein [Armatimonadota bacterium]
MIRRLMTLPGVVSFVALFATLGVSPPGEAAPEAQRFVIVPAESLVTYRVAETFFREGNRLNIAVGTTNAVKGEIIVDRAAPRNSRIGPITVDISTFRSDRERRDQAIRERWLESARFPQAEFRSTAIEGLPPVYRDGEELRLRVTGDLRVRETTRPVTFDVSLALQGSVLRGVAQGTIRMTDFGFEPPAILGILRAENEVRLELRFVARPAP